MKAKTLLLIALILGSLTFTASKCQLALQVMPRKCPFCGHTARMEKRLEMFTVYRCQKCRDTHTALNGPQVSDVLNWYGNEQDHQSRRYPVADSR